MKKVLSVLLTIVLVATFALFALGSSDSETTTDGDQGSGAADNTVLGSYTVEIISCRLAKDYEDKPVAIIKYKFTNNDDEPASFMIAFEDNAYQNGVGLNETVFVDDSANYSSDDQMKEIKKGASLELEIAYDLNDTTTDIEVEIKESFSFDDKIVKKTFSIA